MVLWTCLLPHAKDAGRRRRRSYRSSTSTSSRRQASGGCRGYGGCASGVRRRPKIPVKNERAVLLLTRSPSVKGAQCQAYSCEPTVRGSGLVSLGARLGFASRNLTSRVALSGSIGAKDWSPNESLCDAKSSNQDCHSQFSRCADWPPCPSGDKSCYHVHRAKIAKKSLFQGHFMRYPTQGQALGRFTRNPG